MFKNMKLENQYWLLCFPALSFVILDITMKKCKEKNEKSRIKKLILMQIVFVLIMFVSEFVWHIIFGNSYGFQKMYYQTILCFIGLEFLGIYSIKIQEKLS